MGKFRTFLAITALAICQTGNVKALDIVTWGTAQNILGDSDVVTDGTLKYAYNFGSSGVTSTTVNGVTFAAGAFPTNLSTNTTTIGSVGFSENQGSLYSFNTLGTGSGAFSGLSAAYQALLSTAGTSNQPNTLSLTLNGLTAGQSYKIQWWLNNSSLQVDTSNGFAFMSTSATAGNAITLSANVGAASGNLGQFVTGTFTASGSSAVIALNGVGSYNLLNNRPMINALQLRDVTPVPEPGTYALGAIASVVIAGLNRRRKSARA